MDDDLTKIIAMYETMDSSNSSEKYCFHHLINRYYHNHFFNSLNHPFLDIIFKRIDIMNYIILLLKIIPLILLHL